jgi:hypothetical protein
MNSPEDPELQGTTRTSAHLPVQYSREFVPLAAGFSPMPGGEENSNRFSSFQSADKPLNRRYAVHTGLKPGANETPSVFRVLPPALP